MYYRLSDHYILRGWKKMNAVLVKRPQNRYAKLKPEEFSILSICDGETDFTDIPLTAEEMELLQKFLAKGIVQQTEQRSPLLPDQMYRIYPNRFVESCFWSVTGRCNFRCRHCYMDAPEGALGELTHEEAIDLIDQMAECGVLKVDITGGEPFVRKDFWTLIDRFIDHSIAIGTIYTNSWMLDERALVQFEQRGIKPDISISFDGVGCHDWMRGVQGAENAVLTALALCRKHGFQTNVQFCLHKGNMHVLRDTVRKLTDLGISSMKVGHISDTPLWKANSEGNNISFREYVEAALTYIPYYFADHMPIDLTIGNVITLYQGSTTYAVSTEKSSCNENCANHYLCASARSACYITPEGRLLPCLPMTACKEQEQFARFQDIGLRKGLSDSFYMQFVDKRVKDLLAVNEKCAVCAHKYQCAGGCRAAALEQTGDLMGSDLDQCFLWENGYVEKIHQVADAAIAKYCKKEDAAHEA